MLITRKLNKLFLSYIYLQLYYYSPKKLITEFADSLVHYVFVVLKFSTQLHWLHSFVYQNLTATHI